MNNNFKRSSPAKGGAQRFARTSNFRRAPAFARGNGGFKRGNRGHNQTFSDISKFINKVSVTEEVEVYTPEHTFKDFQIDEKLKANIISKGYNLPTPIQDKSIPHILKGQDIVGIANTGTGKTAAFLIPLIDKVLKNRNENVLIVVPTRELATQIHAELMAFTRLMSIFSVVCVGGASIVPQIKALRYQNNFVIGTPGRLKDLINQKYIPLNKFNTVVLDEADRMLDMGFIDDIRFMMDLMPKPRHTLFFSATMSDEIKGLISKFLTNPVSISVKTRDTSLSIDQDVVRVSSSDQKLDTLAKILKDPECSKVLVFGKTKHGVQHLSEKLVKLGFSAESIHGDKNHAQRQRALGQFKENKSAILVATDVAARGLDIAGVSHVINYDLPSTYEDYIHRIGRTGRAGKKGKALTFIQH